MKRVRQGAALSAFLLVAALGACRSVIGIEDLAVVIDGGEGTDAVADASDASPNDARSDVDSGIDATAAAIAKCQPQGGAACATCCVTELATAFDAFLRGNQQGCGCGGPGTDAACAPDCAGNDDVCPGSPDPPSGSPPQDCRGCVARNAIPYPGCGAARNACEANGACAPALRCLEQCQR